MAATTIHLDPTHIIIGAIAVASLTAAWYTIGERLLGTPPPGHKIDATARLVATAFVAFLTIGPVWLVHLATSGVCT